MKTFLTFSLMLSLAFIACNRNANESTKAAPQSESLMDETDGIVFGQVTAGVATLSQDPSTLKSDWEDFINTNTGLGPCTISDVGFIEDNGLYYLVATGSTSSDPIKSALLMEESAGGCLFISGGVITVTCTTTECSSETMGCMPLNTACTPCQNGGACTKSSTNGISTIFPSIATSACSS